jgi:hypothetical protein
VIERQQIRDNWNRHYHAHAEYYRSLAKIKKKNHREFLLRLKAKKKRCETCKRPFPPEKLVFTYREGTGRSVANMECFSRQAVLNQILKCDVTCRSCMMKKTP